MFPTTHLKWTLLHFGLFLVSSESCEKGFDGKNGGCVDADECVTVPSVCGDNARCFNTHGSYYCNCNEGFQADKHNFTHETGQCRDINECVEDECPGNMKCVNTFGSYNCTCRKGYKTTRLDTDCEDIDECKDAPDVCGTNAQCYNQEGAYSCKCDQGYSNSGNKQLVCTEIVHFCLANE
ncbi:EGF-containing fibulin-like extracellular matrix protein 1 [Carassius auratus]|uniref:EGF-containing fibulin-like extracellular matrix protein 1 n=1 Tax=Carassius auratus TaxID=7957 RepID=A0A6P6Q4G0_CARAU|nr:EGF-containing fibulin-like extracellular matrix protein 1 [Carassius auratus]